MSRNKKTEKVEEVVEIKEEEEKIEEPVKAEETEITEETETPVEESKDEETTEKPVEEEEKIDPRIMAMLSLNRKDKISEKDKQTKIYSAMANIKIVRS